MIDRILDEMFELPVACSGDEIAALTDLALAVIGCGADVVRLVGRAQVRVVVDPGGSPSQRYEEPN